MSLLRKMARTVGEEEEADLPGAVPDTISIDNVEYTVDPAVSMYLQGLEAAVASLTKRVKEGLDAESLIHGRYISLRRQHLY